MKFLKWTCVQIGLTQIQGPYDEADDASGETMYCTDDLTVAGHVRVYDVVQFRQY